MMYVELMLGGIYLHTYYVRLSSLWYMQNEWETSPSMYMCTIGCKLFDEKVPALYCHFTSSEGGKRSILRPFVLLSKTVCCVCVWRLLGLKGIICIQRDTVNSLCVGGLVDVQDQLVNRHGRVSDALSILLAFGRVCVAHKHSTHSPIPFMYPSKLFPITYTHCSLLYTQCISSLCVFPLLLCLTTFPVPWSPLSKMEVMGHTMEELAAHSKTLKANQDATFSEPMKR